MGSNPHGFGPVSYCPSTCALRGIRWCTSWCVPLGIGFPMLPLMARAVTGTRVCVSQSSHNGHQACRASWFRLVHPPRCERMVTRRGPHREVRPRRQSEDCHAAYTAKHVSRWARRRYGRLRGGWCLLRIPRYAEGTRCVRLLTEAQSMPAIRLVECVGHVDNR